MYLGIGGGVLVLIVVGLYFLGSSDIGNSTPNNTAGINSGVGNSSQAKTQPANNQSSSTVEVLPIETFASGLGLWYEEVWYKKTSSSGEVTTGNGINFKSTEGNTRSGIMIDLNKDVSGFNSLTLAANVEADTQSLSGTGWQGREAPVAIAISYQDVSGKDHNLLGENPNDPSQMFWRGFYYLDPTDNSSKTTNGIKVTQGKSYDFSFDLMSLNPKPKEIYYVAIEGAGWGPRTGRVSSINITGGK